MPKQKIPKPKNDNEFLADIAFIVFASGFRFSIVKERFPLMKKAFSNFNVEKLAKFDEKDMERIMASKGMIKNIGKIESIIKNARICSEIRKEHGSVLEWIGKLKEDCKKSPLFSPSLEESFQRFERIGKVTSGWLATLHNAKKDYIEFEVPG